MAEAKETLLHLRFGYMTSRYIYKAFSRRNTLALVSFDYLERVAYSTPRQQTLLAIPALKQYVVQKYALKSVQRFSVPYIYIYIYIYVYLPKLHIYSTVPV